MLSPTHIFYVLVPTTTKIRSYYLQKCTHCAAIFLTSNKIKLKRIYMFYILYSIELIIKLNLKLVLKLIYITYIVRAHDVKYEIVKYIFIRTQEVNTSIYTEMKILESFSSASRSIDFMSKSFRCTLYHNNNNNKSVRI